MEILSFGVGRRMRECERILGELLRNISGRLVLLPIPTTRDNIYISGTDMTLKSITPFCGPNTIIVGYNIPGDLCREAASLGARIFDAGEDERFLLENAKISANGAVGYLLTHTAKDLSEISFGILGYGRIGRELVRLLLLFGADVTLFTTRSSVALELGESGIKSSVIDEGTDFSNIDVLINTAPARLIKEDSLPLKTEILDLASGNIFEPSARLTKLSSIPEAFYPLTAGRLYADAVVRFLNREGMLE